MSRTVITLALCDVCLSEFGSEAEATFSEPVTLGVSARMLELCFDHEQALVEPLRAALEKFGGPVSDRAEWFLDQGRCPICQKTYKHRERLVQHVQREHGHVFSAVLG